MERRPVLVTGAAAAATDDAVVPEELMHAEERAGARAQ